MTFKRSAVIDMHAARIIWTMQPAIIKCEVSSKECVYHSNGASNNANI